MAKTTIDRLIINTPYAEPERHWRYERETRGFDLVEGRRPDLRKAVREADFVQAATLMRRFKIGGLPVVEGPALVGVITESDIFDALVELLGAPEPGGRIEVELGASATALRDVLDVVKEFSPTVDRDIKDIG